MRSVPIAYLLWFFFGVLGVHRFYCNRIGTGVLWLLTGGLFLIGWIVDLFLVPDLVRSANEESRLRGTLREIPRAEPPRSVTVQDYVSPARQDQPLGSLAPGHRVLYCTHCGSAMQVPIQSVGHHFACPSCHHVVIAPG